MSDTPQVGDQVEWVARREGSKLGTVVKLVERPDYLDGLVVLVRLDDYDEQLAFRPEELRRLTALERLRRLTALERLAEVQVKRPT